VVVGRARCAKCTEAIWVKLGIANFTVSDYERMLAAQGWRCALPGCGYTHTVALNQPGLMLVPDHDHATGRVRGLLCGPHNRAIGILGDTPEHLAAAVEYLRR
jgi:hypothetical protein